MRPLFFLISIALYAAPTFARAEWICVARDGRLKSCKSPARCQKLFPACVSAGPIEDTECSDPRCRFTSGEPPAPAPPALPRPKATVPDAPATPKRLFKPGEWPPAATPSLQARAEKLLEEVRTLMHITRRETGLSKVPGASGLSPEQEARLYGGSTSPSGLTPTERVRFVSELARDSELRNEVRRQLASRTSGEHVYDPVAAATLNAVLTDAEGGPKSEDHMKPLAPDEAFGTDKQ